MGADTEKINLSLKGSHSISTLQTDLYPPFPALQPAWLTQLWGKKAGTVLPGKPVSMHLVRSLERAPVLLGQKWRDESAEISHAWGDSTFHYCDGWIAPAWSHHALPTLWHPRGSMSHLQQEAALWPLRIHRPSAKPLSSHGWSQTIDSRHLQSWVAASFDSFILRLQTMPGLCLLYTAQRCVRTQRVAAGCGIPWDICWVASDPTLTLSLNLHQSVNTTHLYLGTPWEPTSCNLSASRGSFINWDKQASSRWSQTGRQNMVCSGTFADLSSGSMLVKASFGALLGPSWAHWASAEAVTNCELLCRCK